ncbi:MAG: hypothetical protein K0M64_06420 [Rhizobium sp.]|nr:hypothetical protein [Rhizobium sp.]
MSFSHFKANTIGMTASFLVFVGMVAGLVVAYRSGVPSSTVNPIFWLSVVVFISYLVFLAKLATQTRRSSIAYVLGATLVFPAGTIYTFVRMLFNVAIATRSATRTSPASPFPRGAS